MFENSFQKVNKLPVFDGFIHFGIQGVTKCKNRNSVDLSVSLLFCLDCVDNSRINGLKDIE